MAGGQKQGPPAMSCATYTGYAFTFNYPGSRLCMGEELLKTWRCVSSPNPAATP